MERGVRFFGNFLFGFVKILRGPKNYIKNVIFRQIKLKFSFNVIFFKRATFNKGIVGVGVGID